LAQQTSSSARQRTGTVGESLVEVDDLKVYFPVTAGVIFQRKVADVRAVDGLSFEVRRGETLGLVGESGCGKSTTGKAILQLTRPTSGKVNFEGTDLTKVKGGELRRFRRKMQMIFQDPYASLNPRMSVGSIISEPLTIHKLASGKEKKERVQNLLQTVGLNPYFANRFRTSSRVASASASALPAPSPSNPTSSFATSQFRPSTCRSRRRSSTCSRTCRTSST